MARERSRIDKYPFIPTLYLAERHNQLIRDDPYGFLGQATHCWREVDPANPLEADYMDRRVLVERIELMEMKANMVLRKMKPAFGIAPQEPGKYEVQFKSRAGKFALHTFAAEYSALKFVLAVINERPYKWVDSDRIRVDDIAIISSHLEKIMDYEMTEDEEAWVMPMPYSFYSGSIATGASWAGEQHSNSRSRGSTRKSLTRQTGAPERSKRSVNLDNDASHASHAHKERASDPKAQLGVEFGIDELAQRLRRDCKQIRSDLRKIMTKPVDGWRWPRDQFDHIIDQIQKNFK